VQRKVSLGAATVANLVAQANNTVPATLTQAEMSQILAYPDLILYPYDPTQAVEVVASQLKVTVTLVNGVATTTTTTVAGYWANANAVTAKATPTCGQQVTIDPNIVSALTAGVSTSGTYNYYVIQGTVLLPGQPSYNQYGSLYGSAAQITLHDSELMIPRNSDTGITGPSPDGC